MVISHDNNFMADLPKVLTLLKQVSREFIKRIKCDISNARQTQ